MKSFPVPLKRDFTSFDETLLFIREDAIRDGDGRQAIAAFWIEKGKVFGQTYVTDVERFIRREEEAGRTVRYID